MNFKIALTAVAVMFTALATSANAVTIDFSSLASGTAVTSQFPGVTVSLVGGVDDGPAIVTDVFESGLALTNSTSSYYPTAFNLNFAFSTAVENVSFVYNNFGGGNGSSYSAFNGSTLLTSGALDGGSEGYYSVDVAGTGITSLNLNNANSTSWQVGLSSISFTAVSAAPEPQTWAMMLVGFGLVGAAMRRRKVAHPAESFA